MELAAHGQLRVEREVRRADQSVLQREVDHPGGSELHVQVLSQLLVFGLGLPGHSCHSCYSWRFSVHREPHEVGEEATARPPASEAGAQRSD